MNTFEQEYKIRDEMVALVRPALDRVLDAVARTYTKSTLTFHTIRDIRICQDVFGNHFPIVDYMANDKSILPLSARYDDLTDDSKRDVLAAYLDVLTGEADTFGDMIETLDKFFSDYWGLIPERKF